MALAADQQSGRQNCHGSILRTGDHNLSMKLLSALDDIFDQEKSLIYFRINVNSVQ
jgi:hypothetical protein